MVTQRRTATMCVLLVLGLTACGSFEASVGREEGRTRTQVASPTPGEGATPAEPASPSPANGDAGDDGQDLAQQNSDAGDDGQDLAQQNSDAGDGQQDGDGNGPSPVLERIRFASGATSATVEGVAAEGAHRRYVFGAREGQTLRIRVTSPSGAVNYGLTAPDGQPIKRVAAEARQGQFELPATGDYAVTLASAIDGAAYTVRVEIE